MEGAALDRTALRPSVAELSSNPMVVMVGSHNSIDGSNVLTNSPAPSPGVVVVRVNSWPAVATN